jgi:hypothetical protein
MLSNNPGLILAVDTQHEKSRIFIRFALFRPILGDFGHGRDATLTKQQPDVFFVIPRQVDECLAGTSTDVSVGWMITNGSDKSLHSPPPSLPLLSSPRDRSLLMSSCTKHHLQPPATPRKTGTPPSPRSLLQFHHM